MEDRRTRSSRTLPHAANDVLTADDDLQRVFRELADTWRAETGSLSSPTQIAAHPAYQRIISLGERALPYIFQDLGSQGGQWYVALRTITGASPVPPEASGRARLVREAWLQWGHNRGYCR